MWKSGANSTAEALRRGVPQRKAILKRQSEIVYKAFEAEFHRRDAKAQRTAEERQFFGAELNGMWYLHG
jgi:hypothetical protein